MRSRAESGPLRPIRPRGDGFVVEGPGFYYWDLDVDEVLRVARELGCGSPQLASSTRLLVPEE